MDPIYIGIRPWGIDRFSPQRRYLQGATLRGSEQWTPRGGARLQRVVAGTAIRTLTGQLDNEYLTCAAASRLL